MELTTSLGPELVPARASRTVAIVGGGFAGAALAYHLLQRGRRGLSVTIVEPDARLGRGVAYGTSDRSLLLNVPAARMSLDPAQPADFVEFAGARSDPFAFLSRAVYGDYVNARLAAAARSRPGVLRVVRARAAFICDDGVRLADGHALRADRVVLATGVASGRCPGLPDDPRVIDGWDERALAALSGDERILVLGTGLTALDVLGVLQRARHRGSVLALSRHGLLPRPHAPRFGGWQLPAELATPPRGLRALLRWGRDVLHAAEHWQHALDALRPLTPAIWQSLSDQDRERFLRHVRPYWEVLRHRAPAAALLSLQAAQARGALEVIAGRILHCNAGPRELELQLRLRGGAERHERVDRLVRCLGPGARLDVARSPLTAALLRDGYARLDPTRSGIATAEHGRLIEPSGRPSERLFALGQLCRPSRWETTAVPEIVRDAVALAELLTQ